MVENFVGEMESVVFETGPRLDVLIVKVTVILQWNVVNLEGIEIHKRR